MAEGVSFDVFLSYSSADGPAVQVIADRLQSEERVSPFLDKWHLSPGMPWQDELAAALAASSSVAFFVGPSGSGSWHHEEMRVALDRAVKTQDDFRVIPVLLPGADEESVKGFLAQRTWVDFRPGLDDVARTRTTSNACEPKAGTGACCGLRRWLPSGCCRTPTTSPNPVCVRDRIRIGSLRRHRSCGRSLRTDPSGRVA